MKSHESHRVGFGYDVHAFKAGRRLMLGGVQIPYALGLEGHSDADVLLHAIADSLLGAAALGDIGRHFPNTDKRYKNISSLALLKRVGRLVQRTGFAVVNVDSTVVLEEPKLSRHVGTMRRRIAAALSIAPAAVSVKATTNEGLGFAGRREGCAAFAVALIVASPSTKP
jgi:2-C-methyl-D-erythritol 2,4-cyclodiphosphate synthase